MADDKKSELYQSVEQFLVEFRRLIEHNPCQLKYHKKNTDTIIRLGYTLNDVEKVLLSLTVEDYYQGPIEDDKGDNNLWVFGKNVEGSLLYIKVKIHTRRDGLEIAYCISFHDPDDPMNTFPLKGFCSGK